MMAICAIVLEQANARCTNVGGHIYIIQERQTNGAAGIYYKVGGVEGNSDQVDRRRGQLQTGNPRQLVVKERYAVHSCRDGESAAHNAVRTYSVNYGGGTEWYRVNSDNYNNFKNSIENAVADDNVQREEVDMLDDSIIQKFISMLA